MKHELTFHLLLMKISIIIIINLSYVSYLTIYQWKKINLLLGIDITLFSGW